MTYLSTTEIQQLARRLQLLEGKIYVKTLAIFKADWERTVSGEKPDVDRVATETREMIMAFVMSLSETERNKIFTTALHKSIIDIIFEQLSVSFLSADLNKDNFAPMFDKYIEQANKQISELQIEYDAAQVVAIAV